jgi:glycosyltransferase involved in cell wall biosynthesis
MIVGEASRMTSPTASLKSLIIKNARDANVVVIPNGLSPGRFLPREKTNRILLVSRIFKRKGYQYFLEALKGMDLDYEINIVGDGPYLGTLQQQAEELGVTANFWGWLSNESVELKELYETSLIFVLPSEAENFPIVLLEAMSAGMAIISTNNTGCREVVGDAALLVEPRSPAALREALIRLMHDDGLRNGLGKAARKRVGDHFTWTAVTKRFLDVYAECAWTSKRQGK